MRVRKLLCVLLALCLSPSLAAEAGVVLVLSGGGTRGFAHIGVIEVLEERKIPIVGIVGTSIGSLIGALKASGYDAAEMRRIVGDLDLPSLLAENTGPMFVFTGNDRRARTSTVSALTYKNSLTTAELEARDTGVLLRLDGTESSWIDLRDPAHLDFEYQQQMNAVVDVLRPAPAPLRAVHLGGAACALARTYKLLSLKLNALYHILKRLQK